MKGSIARVLSTAALTALPSVVLAQALPSEAANAAPRVQTAAEAIAQDAAEYARAIDVDPAEAARRLRAQEETVPVTDSIAREFAGRLAGISIGHKPYYRIVMLLTGDTPVPERTVFAGGMAVPIVFRTGAAATRDRLSAAMVTHRAAIRAALPGSQGMGVDMRTGELVIIADKRSAPDALAETEVELEALTGVPVRIRPLEQENTNFAVDGGERVTGIDPVNGRRFACTTGFAVTDGSRTGVITAAHCPDVLTHRDAAGAVTPLEFVGQWGVGYQDVQVHVGLDAAVGTGTVTGQPIFYAAASPAAARTPTAARARTSTRAGDAVCHRGVTSGYSCALVELVDYAPPGDLCAGPCDPVWTTVAGPRCSGGDSGGPIFNGTVAFGIAKGGSYGRDGRCGFYFYMSTDFLPDGWRLLLGAPDTRTRISG